MSADPVIPEIEFQSTADDSWVPESFRRGLADAAEGRLVDFEPVLRGDSPPQLNTDH
jgi:predicted transcriptional regulator